ncbi:uncharacterized protein TRAVEDRAFT_91974, partial [Trametes versicolor FP-101664 SS1]|uniref:uncharacterized protein n=1 Tax=Trametes versicolor (strain FP-101664) TaxID=717944 RepID=UPI0004622D5F
YMRIAYRNAAVSACRILLGSANAPRWNTNRRGAFQDIAAKADDVVIYETGFAHMQGTRVQRPIVASIIALLNDRLATVWRPQMEFSSPWLY